MPNYVKNRVIFNAMYAEDVRAALLNDEGNVDFNNIIPMPKSLEIEKSTDTELGISLYLETHKDIHIDIQVFPIDAKMREGLDKKKVLELGEKAVNNYIKYGFTDWYEWRCEYWNTKWNACETVVRDDRIEFETAWSAPFPILEMISKKLPYIEFRMEYADEELGTNCGVAVLKNGEYQECDEPADYYKFANSVWGWIE